MFNGAFTEILLFALATLLVIAAVIDVRTFTISNRLNLTVALLAPLYWLSVSLSPWPGIAVQLAAAVTVFVILAGAFYVGMMGGGDVKLAAALALWFPPQSLLQFIVYMSIAGGLVTLVVLAVHRSREGKGRPQIPYGLAIAYGGLAILAQPFLNHFA
jgi:prepilin peptidase CpaA